MNVALGDFWGSYLAGADALGAAPNLSRDCSERLSVGVVHRGDQQRGFGCHGDADVDTPVEAELSILLGGVDALGGASRRRRRP